MIEEEVIEDAIADAAEEVFNGNYSQFELAKMMDRNLIIQNAVRLLNLTYVNSAKDLPAILAENLSQLPGGEDWINRRK
ncbi:hypothetical protein [Kamptonema sp. UHCC 0994]|uniref:hypothetical protein n=1 Tax=Kamptonema sp. UHCC 0994 TaxID=3031329 RepID=UPI0023B9B82E|nr:hypothetical protein [Kamptonema sp. UHCC 0994]MDF0555756.1 hypothetical protein [Kamptonema sp. UHCC 0994]